ncbi:hypothetical protein [Dongshaea marina]|uniref:hypothetical protein n=1 Tax=Dongshaea marina TaxID=2047966 RepID=UPI000D3E8DA7|nr:hypothetical protein [Dongshaea marina]
MRSESKLSKLLSVHPAWLLLVLMLSLGIYLVCRGYARDGIVMQGRYISNMELLHQDDRVTRVVDIQTNQGAVNGHIYLKEPGMNDFASFSVQGKLSVDSEISIRHLQTRQLTASVINNIHQAKHYMNLLSMVNNESALDLKPIYLSRELMIAKYPGTHFFEILYRAKPNGEIQSSSVASALSSTS